ncbi:MAG: hypothetical protein QF864_03970 [SAR202 cluster bacterium]|jgi:hypothetical protein|nr:hypothetical protein [SAR202 cluster bacterium]|tara:strand:- start:1404 stop:3050 length:1647 start_codon:yes stop_codon:yes gene_type:complete
MKFSFIFLFCFVIFACNANSSNTSQIDDSVPQTSNLKITKNQSVEKNTESKSDQSAQPKNIKSKSDVDLNNKNTNSDDLILYIQNQILNAINNNTVNSLDPSKLCAEIPSDKKNNCNRYATTQIQNARAKNSTNTNNNTITSTSESEKSLPNITHFAKNKSDRFFVDFDDIVAGHPYVGARSPSPHNDAQVYFSNTDQRWINAKKPSDYPPIYAVADGYINLPEISFYNVVDHSDSDPPWWHVAYAFTLKIAKNDNNYVEFIYQMEPYMIPGIIDKPNDFYKQFVLVTNGQYVKKGDILAYMYVPSFSEMVGDKGTSSHIAFSLIKQPRTVYVPAIFSEEVVSKFADVYRNPKEGWESESFGFDWNRGRGLPNGMGWMISGEENPFGDNPVDVLIYDGIKDTELDSRAMVYPKDLGFKSANLIYSKYGWGNTIIENIKIEENWQFLFSGIGGPMKVVFRLEENGKYRESKVVELRSGQNFNLTHQHQNNFLKNSDVFSILITDPNNWGWSLAFANKEAEFIAPGSTRDISLKCPPGCPPSPNPYKLKK